jgi:acyl-CoA thioester hydrolase
LPDLLTVGFAKCGKNFPAFLKITENFRFDEPHAGSVSGLGEVHLRFDETENMPEFFQTTHRVLDGEIDGQGHANNIAYLTWMQSAAVDHSSAQGWTTQAYHERGWAWVVRTHFIEYRRPVFAGEVITIRTWVADMNRFTSLRKYEIFREQDLVSRAETNWAFVDTVKARLLPIPQDVAQAFQIPSPEAVRSLKLAGRVDSR